MSDANKAIVRRWFEESINKKNLAVVDELFTQDYVAHMPAGAEPIRGIAGEKALDSMFHSGFPEGVITIEDMVADGDTVVTRLTYRGTHRGDFQGIPATGKTVVMSGMQVSRIANGKIAEAWHMPDFMGMMRQLGVVPAQ